LIGRIECDGLDVGEEVLINARIGKVELLCSFYARSFLQSLQHPQFVLIDEEEILLASIANIGSRLVRWSLSFLAVCK
jgi:hypothetical protein